MSRSPLREQNQGNTSRFHSKESDDGGDCNVLHIKEIPVYWNFERIQKFIRDITKNPKVIDGITFVVIIKVDKPQEPAFLNCGEFLVKFKNAGICKTAYAEWSLISKIRPMKVYFDLDNLYQKKKYYKKPFHFVQRPHQQMDEIMAKRQKFYQNNPPVSSDTDKQETYGLSLQFLNNLKIKLPLSNKLFISNIHPEVTESKLREVFGMAGQVVHAIIIKKEFYDPPKYFAKIEYDHPVEAVQAISMFHNQQLYSWGMIVHMDTKPKHDIPEGLSGVGPGLGPNGEPLRGIRNHIELQPLKQLLNKEGGDAPNDFGGMNNNMPNNSPFVQSMYPPMASNSPMSFQAPMVTQTPMASNSQMSFQAPMVTQTPMASAPLQPQMPMPGQAPNQQSMNPFGPPSSMMNPFNMPAFQNTQMLQNMNQQNPASFQQAVSTMLQNNMNMGVATQNSDTAGNPSSEWQTKPNMGTQIDNTQPNFSAMETKNNHVGYVQNSDSGQRNYDNFSKYDDRDSRESKKSSRDEEKSSNEKSDMLIFKNLPRSVTLQALKNKMQEVGELKFAELTGQGRAIVRFLQTRDANRCVKLFDKSKVDGQTIEVRYF